MNCVFALIIDEMVDWLKTKNKTITYLLTYPLPPAALPKTRFEDVCLMKLKDFCLSHSIHGLLKTD